MRKDIYCHTILLVVLAFFLAEYLNPSAVGVRACINPAPAGPSSPGSQAPAGSEAPTATPHFMINAEAYRWGEYLPSHDFFSPYKSITEQTNLKEIFHPPAVTL